MTGHAGSGAASPRLLRRASHEVYQEKQALDSRGSRPRTNKSIGRNDDLSALLPQGVHRADADLARSTQRSAKQQLPPKAGNCTQALKTAPAEARLPAGT